ncbi:MAG: hypothetical protein H7263_15435 [Candidatus Sericytochromatia bacterium]|nr:hypothetical protein [Candidatus Sericytochromatia bacterium]
MFLKNKIIKNRMRTVVIFATLAFNISACSEGLIISPTYDGGIEIKTSKKSPPRIRSLDYSPKTTARKDDVITFSVDASDQKSNALQYNWKSSKGTLLSNSGNTVSWKPLRGDSSLESGLATITVTVSNGDMTVDASANVFIGNDGRVVDQYNNSNNNSYYPYPTYSPTPAPIYDRSYTSYDNGSNNYDYNQSYNNYPTYNNNQRILFSDDFERGYLNDKWNITYQGYDRNDSYLTWKQLPDDSKSNNSVLVLTGPTDQVLADTCDPEVRITSQAISLRGAKLPRLRFDARSYANPVTAVKLNVYWSSEGNTPRALNVSFIPDKNWNKVDVDLQNIISEEGNSVGLLTIGAVICDNKNEFKGAMIDNIQIYDAAIK